MFNNDAGSFLVRSVASAGGANGDDLEKYGVRVRHLRGTSGFRNERRYESRWRVVLRVGFARSRATCLPGVKKLNVWHNKIHDISIVESMPNLQILNLSSNHVCSLNSLRRCTSLTELYLRRNKLSSLSELDSIRGCSRLRSAWFAGNPFCQDFASIQDYRLAVVNALPQLTFLDNILITNEEKALARALTSDSPAETTNFVDDGPTDDVNRGLGGFFETSSRSSTLKASLEKSVVVNRIDVEDAIDRVDERSEPIEDWAILGGQGLDGNASVGGDDDAEGKSASEEEMLQSSLRFFVAESNCIRETLGLKPIDLEDGHRHGDGVDEGDGDDATIEDVDSGAIDGDDDGDEDDDFGDDELDILDSYADVLDDGDDVESFAEEFEKHEETEEENEVGEEAVEATLSGDHVGKNGRYWKAGSASMSESSFVPVETRSSVLTATLLLLQNLSTEELREVERESSRLRLVKKKEERWIET